MRLAVINGYTADARSALCHSGITPGEDLFSVVFGRLLPEAELEVLFPADPTFRAPDLERYSGFLWTGSNGTIYKDGPENRRQLELMQGMLRSGRPVWGSCWGLQVAVVAAGGQVGPCRNGREWMAARRVRLSEAGSAHKMFRGKPSEFDGFVMHLDEVTRVPDGAVVLASNPHCKVQALEIVVDRCTFWGTQYHPEYDCARMGQLILSRAEALHGEGFAADPEEFRRIADRLHRLGDLAENQNVRSEEELAAHPETMGLARDLDLHWSILGREHREAELRNWIAHVLRPSLAVCS